MVSNWTGRHPFFFLSGKQGGSVDIISQEGLEMWSRSDQTKKELDPAYRHREKRWKGKHCTWKYSRDKI